MFIKTTTRVSGDEIAHKREPLKVKMGAAIGGVAGAALWMVILILTRRTHSCISSSEVSKPCFSSFPASSWAAESPAFRS
jgi:hypothetical protein